MRSAGFKKPIAGSRAILRDIDPHRCRAAGAPGREGVARRIPVSPHIHRPTKGRDPAGSSGDEFIVGPYRTDSRNACGSDRKREQTLRATRRRQRMPAGGPQPVQASDRRRRAAATENTAGAGSGRTGRPEWIAEFYGFPAGRASSIVQLSPSARLRVTVRTAQPSGGCSRAIE